MQLHINPANELPIYRQIMRQIMDAVAGGIMKPGDKLPSHRELASQLVIAPLTVKKAYDELEREGILRTERGRGTFVSDRQQKADPAAARERLRDDAQRLVSKARLCGVPIAGVVSLLEEVAEGHSS
ncbi:MAG: GntR family transcriptional regulator [Planctomycetota bacterium]